MVDPKVVFLCEALKDGDSQRRRWATEALVEIGEPAVVPLCEALKDAVDGTRQRAAGALELIGDVRAVSPLCEALRDRNRVTRIVAGQALGKIAERNPVLELREAIPVLQQFLGSWEVGLQEKLAYWALFDQIEAATKTMKGLVQPAGGPTCSPEPLLVPAGPPASAGDDPFKR